MGVGALLALIGPPLFQVAEQLFQGQKLGGTRMNWVQAAAQTFIEALVTGTKVTNVPAIPATTKTTDAEMKTSLEALFQVTKASGQLVPQAAPQLNWAMVELGRVIQIPTVPPPSAPPRAEANAQK